MDIWLKGYWYVIDWWLKGDGKVIDSVGDW